MTAAVPGIFLNFTYESHPLRTSANLSSLPSDGKLFGATQHVYACTRKILIYPEDLRSSPLLSSPPSENSSARAFFVEWPKGLLLVVCHLFDGNCIS